MKQNVRVFHRFPGYTVKDCDCRYCLYYGGRKAGCPLDVCCCAQERREAAARLAANRKQDYEQ